MKATTLILSLFFGLQPLWLLANPAELPSLSKKLLKESVPFITTAQLSKELKAAKILLLDTREKKEFAVSHLPGAHWVGYDDFQMERVAKIPRTTRIVVYCSMGYRSEKIGVQLKKAGFHQVQNLFTGLFNWANEGRPLEDRSGKATRSVHGFDDDWARYLSPQIKKVLD